MPYIKQEDRLWINNRIEAWPQPRNAGELNYVLTIIAKNYWKDNGQNYQAFNDITGAFHNCLAEFNRRDVVPYENKKIAENGDI